MIGVDAAAPLELNEPATRDRRTDGRPASASGAAAPGFATIQREKIDSFADRRNNVEVYTDQVSEL